MEDQIISLETAKLAKEKGFFMWSRWRYNTYKSYKLEPTPSFKHGLNRDKEQIYAPTQSLLQKWLREKHNLHIEIIYMDDLLKYSYKITDISINTESIEKYKDNYFEEKGYEFEEALEVGLFNALNYINV